MANLWKEYFDFLKANSIGTVFFHNLGAFDGYFLFKGLSNYAEPEDVSTIIDDSNKFIVIGLDESPIIPEGLSDDEIVSDIPTGYSVKFKDSYRIYSVSLNSLCKVFDVPGKLTKYDSTFNSSRKR